MSTSVSQNCVVAAAVRVNNTVSVSFSICAAQRVDVRFSRKRTSSLFVFVETTVVEVD